MYKTISEVSKISGVSVRMLHYYDEIGLFKSSSKSEAGYRLYDDNDLKELKEILFFKELEVPLKEIKRIMDSPYFDKIKTLKEQKKLLSLKRDRLNGIIESLDKTIRGENNMSFKEFDMTEYYKVLEEYRDSNKENIIKTFGSIEKFDDFIEYIKNEEKIALHTVKAYGSTEKYAKEVRKVLNNKKFNNMSNGFKKFWDDCFSRKNESLDLYFRELSKNKNKNKKAHSLELQEIAKNLTEKLKKDYEIFADKKGEDYWYHTINSFKSDVKTIENIDKLYGRGTANFIYEVFSIYLKNKRPKLDILYEDLASHLGEDPYSKEVQSIVKEIEKVTKENNEFMKGKVEVDYKVMLSNIGDIYIKSGETNNSKFDRDYGKGASVFIGKALKAYASI